MYSNTGNVYLPSTESSGILIGQAQSPSPWSSLKWVELSTSAGLAPFVTNLINKPGQNEGSCNYT